MGRVVEDLEWRGKERTALARPPLAEMLRNAARRRCPNCRLGPIFERWPNKMLEKCPRCGLGYFREQGYFIGGMIFTYGLTAAVLLAVFLAGLLIPNPPAMSHWAEFGLWVALGVPVMLLWMPFGYSLWLNLDFWLEPWKPERTR
jgi:uncharacterized protein (DUF983 family)